MPQLQELPIYSEIQETPEQVLQSQMETNTSSKRALALLGMSQAENSRGDTKKDSDSNTILKTGRKLNNPRPTLAKENIGLKRRIDAINSMQLSKRHTSPSSSSSLKLKSCLICREQSKLPYAAQCGHICCFQCWQHWFKVKSSCPVCRIDSSLETIIKITIQ